MTLFKQALCVHGFLLWENCERPVRLICLERRLVHNIAGAGSFDRFLCWLFYKSSYMIHCYRHPTRNYLNIQFLILRTFWYATLHYAVTIQCFYNIDEFLTLRFGTCNSVLLYFLLLFQTIANYLLCSIISCSNIHGLT